MQEAEQTLIPAVEHVIRECYGKPTLVGEWASVTKKGRFNGTEGIAVKIMKWETFEDRKGSKQCRDSHDLIASDFLDSHHIRDHIADGKPKC